MSRSRLLRLLVLLGLLVGCAPPAVMQDQRTRPIQLTEEVWFDAPSGWVDLGAAGDGHVFTRDGLGLGHIAVGFELWADLAPAHHHPALDLEVAYAFWGQLMRDYRPDVLVLEEMAPALVGGHPGFVLRAAWRGGDGLRQRLVVYGARVERHLVWWRFQAPALHQFNRQLPTFQAMLQGISVR